jgi:hypothetical protein
MTPIGHGQPSSGLRDCVTITASCTDYLWTRALVPCLVLYESALELVWGPPYVHYSLPSVPIRFLFASLRSGLMYSAGDIYG